jgi:toxin HigB-1
MIVSFRHKGLGELFTKGRSARVPPELKDRCTRRLDALDSALTLENLNLPGFNLHALHTTPVRHSIHVNGPWCITFEWENGNALRVDLEQYH